MIKDDTYYLHQTPESLTPLLINEVPLEPNDKVLEPFRGEGNFYNHIPATCTKDWCEITEGRDYKDYNLPVVLHLDLKQ